MIPSILIVDDEKTFLDSVKMMLKLENYDDLTGESDSTKVPNLIDQKAFDIAFLDITMPELDGLDLLKIIKEKSPETECIMVTANDAIESVMSATKLGAYDYLIKPVSPEQLIHALNQALEHRTLIESLRLRSESAIDKALKKPEAFSHIITANKKMLRLLHEAELHAFSEIPILITGETGVGKELLARAIHNASKRLDGPFVAVNMLALSSSLFESEFFGHAKGAFTGADREKEGYLAKAKGGTLFLDEIGDLSMEIQGKLLRILQEGEYTPVGKTRSQKADIRFIAATNQDLDKAVREGRFRKDLFYRLQFAHLTLPHLCDRRDDIPLLAARFLEESARPKTILSEEAEAALCAYEWPGNVRELKGSLEAAANLAESGTITQKHLRIPIRTIKQTPQMEATTTGNLEPLAEVEKRHILAVYEAVGQNKSEAARVLEIGLQTLYRKLKSYNVD